MQIDSDIHIFDPGNLARLYAQDYVGEVYGSWPGFAPRTLKEMPDDKLAVFLTDLANAVRLPLNLDFIDGMEALREAAFEERARRARKAKKRREDVERYGESHWSNTDLLALVSAVAGDGRRVGKQWWFHCPLPGHANGDRDASLEVDAERKLWKCQSLHGGGGVVAWRKMIEAS